MVRWIFTPNIYDQLKNRVLNAPNKAEFKQIGLCNCSKYICFIYKQSREFWNKRFQQTFSTQVLKPVFKGYLMLVLEQVWATGGD